MPSAPLWQPIAGFEHSAYAWLAGRIVWVGSAPRTRHPRQASQPWQPAPRNFNPQRLGAGAHAAQAWLASQPQAAASGLLPWLFGQPLAFPLHAAGPRLDAMRAALETQQLDAVEAAALRLLGLGPGLTPSGDDFIGGIFFALAHAPRPAWQHAMPAVHARVRQAAAGATNPISAALLDDLLQGASYSLLHEVLAALDAPDHRAIAPATTALLNLGASSGADLLCGLLLALTTPPEPTSIPSS